MPTDRNSYHMLLPCNNHVEIICLAGFLLVAGYLRGFSILGQVSSVYVGSALITILLLTLILRKINGIHTLRIKKPPTEVVLLMPLFLFSSVYGIINAENILLATRFSLELTQVFLIFYLFFLFGRTHHFGNGFYIIYLSLCLPILSYLLAQGLADILSGDFRRLGSFPSQNTNINIVAATAAGVIGSSFVLFIASEGILKYISFANLFVALPVLFLSGSRKAMLALVLICLTLLILSIKKSGIRYALRIKILNYLIVSIFFIFFTASLCLTALYDNFHPFLSRFSAESITLAIESRFSTQAEALSTAFETPLDLLFGGAQDRYHGFRFLRDKTVIVTHNIVVDAVIYLGIPFALLFCVFLVSRIYLSIATIFSPRMHVSDDARIESLIMMFLFIPVLIHALTGGAITRELSFWAFLGALVGIQKRLRKFCLVTSRQG